MTGTARGELLSFVDEAFDARAWHGPTLRRSVRGVTPVQAAWRPAPGRHNIWEVTVHTAYWKHEVCRRLGVTQTTFYRWKSKYGGMEVSDARKLKALEEENRRLKHIVADLTLDVQMLKAVNAKKW